MILVVLQAVYKCLITHPSYMFWTPENCNFNILSPLSSTAIAITTNAVFELARC